MSTGDPRISQAATKTRTRRATHSSHLISAAECPACGCQHCLASQLQPGMAWCGLCGERFPWPPVESSGIAPVDRLLGTEAAPASEADAPGRCRNEYHAVLGPVVDQMVIGVDWGSGDDATVITVVTPAPAEPDAIDVPPEDYTVEDLAPVITTGQRRLL